MGTQQILLIVLSVIIVGVAVVLGIQMTTRLSQSSNLDACRQEALGYVNQAQQYWRMPVEQGGGGRGDATNWTANKLCAYIKPGNTNNVISSANGTFTFTVTGESVTIAITGKENGTSTVVYTMASDNITTN